MAKVRSCMHGDPFVQLTMDIGQNKSALPASLVNAGWMVSIKRTHEVRSSYVSNEGFVEEGGLR